MALENLNKVLGAIRRKIEQRRRSIYEAIKEAFSDYEQETYEKAVKSYNSTLKVLAGSVERFNTAVNKRNETREQLITDNLRVVRKEYYPLFDNYKVALEGQKSTNKAITDKEKEIEDVKLEIKGLFHRG